MSNFDYEFSGLQLKQVDRYPWPEMPDFCDVDDYWKKQGFKKRSFISEREWTIDGPFEITLRQHQEFGFMVEICIEDGGLMDVHCPSPLDLLEFIKAYLVPLSQMNFHGDVREVIAGVFEFMFDPDAGLECVQRVTQRQNEAAYRRRLAAKK